MGIRSITECCLQAPPSVDPAPLANSASTSSLYTVQSVARCTEKVDSSPTAGLAWFTASLDTGEGRGHTREVGVVTREVGGVAPMLTCT